MKCKRDYLIFNSKTVIIKKTMMLLIVAVVTITCLTFSSCGVGCGKPKHDTTTDSLNKILADPITIPFDPANVIEYKKANSYVTQYSRDYGATNILKDRTIAFYFNVSPELTEYMTQLRALMSAPHNDPSKYGIHFILARDDDEQNAEGAKTNQLKLLTAALHKDKKHIYIQGTGGDNQNYYLFKNTGHTDAQDFLFEPNYTAGYSVTIDDSPFPYNLITTSDARQYVDRYYDRGTNPNADMQGCSYVIPAKKFVDFYLAANALGDFKKVEVIFGETPYRRSTFVITGIRSVAQPPQDPPLPPITHNVLVYNAGGPASMLEFCRPCPKCSDNINDGYGLSLESPYEAAKDKILFTPDTTTRR